MIERIIIYTLASMIVALSAYGLYYRHQTKVLNDDIIQLNNAVSAYEELIKVVPFNRVVEEKEKNAEDEINATLNDINAIPDGNYRL